MTQKVQEYHQSIELIESNRTIPISASLAKSGSPNSRTNLYRIPPPATPSGTASETLNKTLPFGSPKRAHSNHPTPETNG